MIGNHSGHPLYSGHPPSQVPALHLSPLPSSHVCRTWAVRSRFRGTRYPIARLDNAKPANECGLDGINGNFQSDRGSDICCSGLSFTVNCVTVALLTCKQVPEKIRPLKYDIYGSSHQVLHVAVIVAGLAHMFGLFRAFDYLHTVGSVCS